MRSRSGTAVDRASASASMMSLRLHTNECGATTRGALASVTQPRITMCSSSAVALAAAPNPASATKATGRAILSLVMCTPPQPGNATCAPDRLRPGSIDVIEWVWAGMDRRVMVGATGFEPATSRSQSERSTRLSYAPSHEGARLSLRWVVSAESRRIASDPQRQQQKPQKVPREPEPLRQPGAAREGRDRVVEHVCRKSRKRDDGDDHNGRQ